MTIYTKVFTKSMLPLSSPPSLLLVQRCNFPANDIDIDETILGLRRAMGLHNAVGLLHRHHHNSLDAERIVHEPSPLQIDNRIARPRDAILLGNLVAQRPSRPLEQSFYLGVGDVFGQLANVDGRPRGNDPC
jgi:hypothetical protein